MPDRSLDVHMDRDGLNFSCQECHHTEGHKISGRCYAHPAAAPDERVQLPFFDEKRILCAGCHSDRPHQEMEKLNDHTDKIACQTCHIPHFAKSKPTKMRWDWSTAGQKDDKGKGIIKKDEHGHVVYNYKKGSFVMATNVEPQYFWFNGVVKNTILGDKIDPSEIVEINKLFGDYNDPSAKIWPFKVHEGVQPYDKQLKQLLIPKLFGKKGTGAYWAEYDWDKAFKAGMDYVGEEYSGEYGWVESKMYWLISHQVAPKGQSLHCNDCHSVDGRLSKLSGFYLPGRDKNSISDQIGLAIVALTFIGVLIHGIGRAITRKDK